MEVRRMRPKPKISALEKRIKPNPKYVGVEPVVNTGNNLRTELEKLDEIHQFYKFRNNEIFRRITINNLVNLMTEVGKLEYQLNTWRNDTEPTLRDTDSEGEEEEQGQKEESVENIDTLIRSQFNPRPPGHTGSRHSSRRGTARSVTSLAVGIGELDKTRPLAAPPRPETRPFLLLDVRDPDLYSRAHISLSVNYPAIRLNRAFDYETREMLRLKNKEKAAIVVYDDDETIAVKCATTLTQRGYDNVFLLSGGLRVAALKYPESLVTDRELERMEEGDIMVIEKLLEENITKGSSRLTGSRVGSHRSTQVSRRSISLDRGSMAGLQGWGGAVHRGAGYEAPMRTSTVLGKNKNRFL